MELEGLKHVARGKVRDMYAVGDEHLLIVASDRISAFDVVLPTPIPDKGKVLTQLSAFWFMELLQPREHHLVTTDVDRMPEAVRRHAKLLRGRATLARKVEVIPIECVARGYLAGSGWKEYQEHGTVCGLRLPPGLQESALLPEPIFTPSTKAVTGHDENISMARTIELIGKPTAVLLQQRTLDYYGRAAAHARDRGILLADTKLEFGRLPGGEIILIDECFTPDSSRFWPADQFRPGKAQPSFDKQFVRDFLTRSGWNKEPPAPELPADVVSGTRERYLQAFELLTGRTLEL